MLKTGKTQCHSISIRHKELLPFKFNKRCPFLYQKRHFSAFISAFCIISPHFIDISGRNKKCGVIAFTQYTPHFIALSNSRQPLRNDLRYP